MPRGIIKPTNYAMRTEARMRCYDNAAKFSGLRETVSNQVTISFDTEDPVRHAMLTSQHVRLCVCVCEEVSRNENDAQVLSLHQPKLRW